MAHSIRWIDASNGGEETRFALMIGDTQHALVRLGQAGWHAEISAAGFFPGRATARRTEAMAVCEHLLAKHFTAIANELDTRAKERR